MSRLFLKIFVWFWIVQLLIGAVMFTVTTAMRFQPEPERERPETAFALGVLARQTSAAYERGGATQAQKTLRDAQRAMHGRFFFFDAQGRELLGASNPNAHIFNAPNFQTNDAPNEPPPNAPPPNAPQSAPPNFPPNGTSPNENAPPRFQENAAPPRDFRPPRFPQGDFPPPTDFPPPNAPPRDEARRDGARRDDHNDARGALLDIVRDFVQSNAGTSTQNSARPNAWRRGSLSAQEIVSTRGARYLLVAQLERPPLRPFSPGFVGDLIRPSGPSALRLLILVLTSGVLCFGLARYLTSPAVKLRRATQQFSNGDLTTRVAPQMGRRRDELADLGRDFDQMAQRLETSMLAERRLLADISHELRSPLARLTVALDLIEEIENDAKNAISSTRSSEEMPPREKIEPYLARIRRESERLNAMIGQVLTLSRLESGLAQVDKTPIELTTLLREVAQDADFEARRRNRRVVVTKCETLRSRGSRDLLRSAIENVVRNAVHYTKENSTVEISLVRDAKNPDLALIRVLDCGAGVPQDALPNLFRPFYRVADARDRKSGGTGLGLAIAERAVRMHGGTVSASNAPNDGLLVELRFVLLTV